MQYSFGSGVLFGRSLTNTPATPVRFGGLQDVSIDFSFTTKELFGQYQFPIALGRGTAKVTGKASFAQFNAQAFNDLFFGNSNPATGQEVTAVAEAQTVTSNAVTVTHAANFLTDLGVVRASDGAVYTRVTSGPVALQYSCNETTGVYSFNSSQNNVPVLNSYVWNDTANGKIITIDNQLLGVTPTFTAVFTEEFKGKKMTLVLNACVSSKLAIATKLEDFTIPQFDFSAFVDDANELGSFSMSE
jgi:hypothetical protein